MNRGAVTTVEPGWLHDQATRTFRKTLPAEQAITEARGWRRLRGLLPVPELLGHLDRGQLHTLVYADVFAPGRSRWLLADAITAADTDPVNAPAVTSLVNAVCDSWAYTMAATGRTAPLADCVPALYAYRLRVGGRLDTWYAAVPPSTVVTGTGSMRLHLSGITDRLRQTLTPESRWPTAITQGDPTEPNIADPLCWLDLEHAGRNTLAGEAANLLWYLLGMGGWLVPVYQPATYTRTLTRPGNGPLPPLITHLRTGSGHIEIDYALQARPGRRAALDALLSRLHTDIGEHLTLCGHDPAAALRPWLVLRILGVIPLTTMTATDTAVCLAILASVLDPTRTLTDLAHTDTPVERQ